ncbi:MAG: dockerin type I repeat-containing protein [Candidatus Helarchaeota archaeon]
MKPKTIFILLFLFVSVGYAHAETLLNLGEETVINSFDIHNTEIKIGSIGVISIGSEGNRAWVQTVAPPNVQSIGEARIGFNWALDLQGQEWSTLADTPVFITVDYSYTLDAHWTLGSADAEIRFPAVLDSGPWYDGIGYVFGTSGTIEKQNVTEAFETTLAQIVASGCLEDLVRGTFVFMVRAHAHSAWNKYDDPPNSYSSSEFIIYSVSISFEDNTPPEVRHRLFGDTYTGGPNLEIIATDENSGIQSIQYSFGGEWFEIYPTNNPSMEPSMELIEHIGAVDCYFINSNGLENGGLIQYKAIDNNGNESPIKTIPIRNKTSTARCKHRICMGGYGAGYCERFYINYTSNYYEIDTNIIMLDSLKLNLKLKDHTFADLDRMSQCNTYYFDTNYFSVYGGNIFIDSLPISSGHADNRFTGFSKKNLGIWKWKTGPEFRIRNKLYSICSNTWLNKYSFAFITPVGGWVIESTDNLIELEFGLLSSDSLFIASDSIFQNETKSYEVNIDSGIEEMSFYLNWPGSDLDLKLFSPDGREILRDANLNDFEVEFIEDERFEFYKIHQPLPGKWSLSISAVDVPISGEKFLAYANFETQLRLILSDFEEKYAIGENVYFTAKLNDSSNSIEVDSINATVSNPEGGIASISLFDDGLHNDILTNDGVYGGVVSDTALSGIYQVSVNAKGTNNGEQFERGSFGQFFVEPDTGEVTNPGDLDADGDIDSADYSLFRSTLGKCDGDEGFISNADYDEDGCVTYADYRIWYGYYRNQ